MSVETGGHFSEKESVHRLGDKLCIARFASLRQEGSENEKVVFSTSPQEPLTPRVLEVGVCDYPTLTHSSLRNPEGGFFRAALGAIRNRWRPGNEAARS